MSITIAERAVLAQYRAERAQQSHPTPKRAGKPRGFRRMLPTRVRTRAGLIVEAVAPCHVTPDAECVSCAVTSLAVVVAASCADDARRYGRAARPLRVKVERLSSRLVRGFAALDAHDARRASFALAGVLPRWQETRDVLTSALEAGAQDLTTAEDALQSVDAPFRLASAFVSFPQTPGAPVLPSAAAYRWAAANVDDHAAALRRVRRTIRAADTSGVHLER